MPKSALAPTTAPKPPDTKDASPSEPHLVPVERHPLSPARGVILGVLAGLAIWLAIVWACFRLF